MDYDIVVCGAGAFGISVVRSLIELDPKPRIVLIDENYSGSVTASRSPFKAIRYQYPTEFWTKIAKQDVNRWTKFPQYYQSGWLRICENPLPPHLAQFEKRIDEHDAKKKNPLLQDANLPGSTHYYECSDPGVVKADDFLVVELEAAKKAGVETVSGKVTGLIKGQDGSTKGVSYQDLDGEKQISAEKVTIAMGARTSQFCEKLGIPLPGGFVSAGIAMVVFELPPDTDTAAGPLPLLMFDDVEILGPIAGNTVIVHNRKSFADISGSTAVLKPDSTPHQQLTDFIRKICPKLMQFPMHRLTMYDGMSPSGAPLIDHLPGYPGVIVVGFGNYHFFKFYHKVGELATTLIVGNKLPEPWDRKCSWNQTKTEDDEHPHPGLIPKGPLRQDQFVDTAKTGGQRRI